MDKKTNEELLRMSEHDALLYLAHRDKERKKVEMYNKKYDCGMKEAKT